MIMNPDLKTQPVGPSFFEERRRTLVTWLGMAGALINAHGTILLIDPLISTVERDGEVVSEEGYRLKLPLPLEAKDVPRVDLVMYTHADDDHLGRMTAKTLAGRTRARFIAPHMVECILWEQEIDEERITTAQDFMTLKAGEAEIYVTPALHDWQEVDPYQRGDCCGYLVKTPDGTIWHPGDTRLIDELGERAKQLEAVSMDMCAPYILETKARAPQAEIAFDPFHVVKLANEAVHDVRRTEARERKGSAEAAVLKGSRWALLKAPESLRAEEHVRLSAVAGLNARVFRAYLLKEELRALYRCGPRSAPEHLRSWLSWASRSNLGPFVKLGRTLRQYRDGVLAAIRLRLSNGRMEGLNNKIGVIKHRAYGFHSFAALAAMVFLCCTDLQLKLPI